MSNYLLDNSSVILDDGAGNNLIYVLPQFPFMLALRLRLYAAMALVLIIV